MPKPCPSIELESAVAPFLKWAGGKRWMVARHADLFPNAYLRYIEPFVGSGAVFFHLKPKRAILSDLNGELICTYQAVKDDWEKVLTVLRRHQELHSFRHYYTTRERVPCTMHERAARLIYLNRTCWNALYRVNRDGRFNVPKGTKSTVLLENDFETASRLLQTASLKTSDFEAVIDRAGKGDFVFADPPYTVRHNTNNFVKYNERLFSWHDQIRLRDCVRRAVNRGAVVMVTNAAHPSIRELYRGPFELIEATRSSVIAASSRNRGRFTELIIRSRN